MVSKAEETILPNNTKVEFKKKKYGLYESEIVGIVEDENTPMGYSNAVDNVVHVKKTTKIPAQLGVEFGTEWETKSKEDGFIQVERVWIFPRPMINYNGESFSEIRTTEYIMANGGHEFSGYSFEKEFEIIKGTWTYQVFYNGKKVLEQKFQVK